MAASENRFAPLLIEKEVIELLENATPRRIKKATKCGMKIGKKVKTENSVLTIEASELVKAKQCKLGQFTHLKIICTL